ncbi:MAG: hypothetical protein CSYNP_01378 [Syntrophus sp. SKADARSKE-3]|nr:hypothetical protein [Syntrophus sp. SKADARSKE-3]
MNREIPLCDIRIDKEGIWYFRGAEMFRREIVNFFYENMRLDETGQYLIELPGENGDRCYVEVEDTAFVVKSVFVKNISDNGRKSIILGLSDDTEEILDPATLKIGEENVLYCVIKKSANNRIFKARFSRAGYYQLAEYIDYDDVNDAYFIVLNDQRYFIQ